MEDIPEAVDVVPEREMPAESFETLRRRREDKKKKKERDACNNTNSDSNDKQHVFKKKRHQSLRQRRTHQVQLEICLVAAERVLQIVRRDLEPQHQVRRQQNCSI